MPELSTKFRILTALSRTGKDDFSVAELMAWTGLTKDQIEPQIARLKEQQIIQDAPVQRTGAEKLSRGRPSKLYQRVEDASAGNRIYTELARVRRSLGLPDPISLELEHGLDLLGKLEAVLNFAEVRETPLTAREQEALGSQIAEIESALKLAGMEADLDDEESIESRQLIEAWRRKQQSAAKLEQLQQREPARTPVRRGWRPAIAWGEHWQGVTSKAFCHARSDSNLVNAIVGEYLRDERKTRKAPVRIHDVWHPFYDRAQQIHDSQSKGIVMGFLDEARDESRTLESIEGHLNALECRNYALAKTAARYLPDPDIPLKFKVASARRRPMIPEVLLNAAIFLVRAQRPAEEVYPLWRKALSAYKLHFTPVRLELAAIVQMGRLTADSWQRLECTMAPAASFSFVTRLEIGFIHRPFEVMNPLLDSTVSGPVEFAHPMEPSYYVYGAVKDLLAHNAGVDYLQLAQGMCAVGAPESMAWGAARKVDEQHGLVLVVRPAAHGPRQTVNLDALRKILEADLGAEVLCPAPEHVRL